MLLSPTFWQPFIVFTMQKDSDQKLMAELRSRGGEKYVQLGSLVYRQARPGLQRHSPVGFRTLLSVRSPAPRRRRGTTKQACLSAPVTGLACNRGKFLSMLDPIRRRRVAVHEGRNSKANAGVAYVQVFSNFS